MPRGVLRRYRAAASLDELDEPIGGVERELHVSTVTRTYVRVNVLTKGRLGGPLHVLGGVAPVLGARSFHS